MATFLFAWELGGGLGHVTVIKPLAQRLAERGHRVLVAARNVGSARLVLESAGIAWLQAPIKLGAASKLFEPTRTFAHILHNTCFSELTDVCALVAAWRNLFDLVRPDVVIADHAPTALLAARIAAVKRATIGTGFCCPAVGDCFPDWRPQLGQASEQLAVEEGRVLSVVNACLREQQSPELARLSDLYATEETLLGTYPELDPCGARPGVRYRGVWSHGLGIEPWWPPVSGRRVFAYLKNFSGIRNVLSVLRASRQPSIVFCTGLPAETAREYAGTNIAFAKKPVELAAAAAQCDIAITHATHGTAATMLVAGKPQLLFPLQLEQRLTAQAIVKHGAGLAAKPDDLDHIAGRLKRLITEPAFRDAAQAVQRRHQNVTPDRELEIAANDLEALST